MYFPMNNSFFQTNLGPSNSQTDFWKKRLIRKDLKGERWGLECRKIVLIIAYVAGIIRVNLLEKGTFEFYDSTLNGESCSKKRKKRVTKTTTWSVYSEKWKLGGQHLLNNWDVNLKGRKLPWKWGVHSFQHGSNDIRGDNNVLTILPHLEHI